MNRPETFASAKLDLELSPYRFDEAAGDWVHDTDPVNAVVWLQLEGDNGVLRLEYQLPRTELARLLGGRAVTATLTPDGLHGLHRPDRYLPMEYAPTTLRLTPAGDRQFDLLGGGDAVAADGTRWAFAIDQLARLEELTSEDVNQSKAEAALQAIWPEWRESGGTETWLQLDGPDREQLILSWPDPIELEAPDTVSEPPQRAPLDTTHWESPTDDRPLVLDGKALPLRAATLQLAIETEHWSSEKDAWVYGLPEMKLGITLDVDEDSGEDGAPAPDARLCLPTFSGSWRDLFTATWRESEVAIEAWYGNDAPSLDQNVITLLGLEPGGVRVRWQAQYETREGTFPFLFEGLCQLEGPRMGVKKPEDAPQLLDKVFPDGSWREWGAPEQSTVDLGKWAPDERRHWIALKYALPTAQP